jgi:hypothetical protein
MWSEPGSQIEWGLEHMKRVPGSEMHILPWSGHHLPTDQSARWVHIVTDWLLAPPSSQTWGSIFPTGTSTVLAYGVPLADDGSFTIRVNQPEGRQVVAFTALSPRGSERRMIVLGIERNTKELERQYFDGGHPEGEGG